MLQLALPAYFGKEGEFHPDEKLCPIDTFDIQMTIVPIE